MCTFAIARCECSTGIKLKVLLKCLAVNGLIDVADQETVGGLLQRAITGIVTEVLQVEVHAQFTIKACQQVQIEGGCDTL